MIDATLLIVDDDRDILETARMFLKAEFSEIIVEKDPVRIPGHMNSKKIDLVLLDMNFRRGLNEGEEGFYWLEFILEIDPDAVVILITAYGEIDLAVNAMKKGAADFILKPWKNQKLLGTVLSALKLRWSKEKVHKLTAENENINSDWDRQFSDFIGDSPQILRVKELISRVAPTDANILITGENGTGKEVVARALHRNSHRKDQPFIRVDVGALHENLFESEMFGHVRGAFTDARENKTGRIALAEHGTLFLDEIGNLGPGPQSKLLTYLQNRTIVPVGSAREIRVDTRVISATNRSLRKMVREGHFREDLMYRMNTVEIEVPPLRERREDIEALAHFFLVKYNTRYRKGVLRWSPRALERLRSYPWPGNVRELQHTVERAVILSDGSIIQPNEVLVDQGKAGDKDVKTLDENERQFMIRKLNENDWNISRTADEIGLTRTAMYRRMRKHGISR